MAPPELRRLAHEAVRAFNAHTASCPVCELPPGPLCEEGHRLDIEASRISGEALAAEVAAARRDGTW